MPCSLSLRVHDGARLSADSIAAYTAVALRGFCDDPTPLFCAEHRVPAGMSYSSLPAAEQVPEGRDESQVPLDEDGEPLVNGLAGKNIREVLSRSRGSLSGRKRGRESIANADDFLSFDMASPSGAAGKEAKSRRRHSDRLNDANNSNGHDVGEEGSDSDNYIAAISDIDSDEDSVSSSSSSSSRSKGPSNRIASALHPMPTSPLLLLHNEILDFCECIQPTELETANRLRVVEEIKTVAQELWQREHKNGKLRVDIFGSTLTGLALPTSDVDIVIFGAPENSPKKSILKLGKELKQRKLVSYLETITGARVPIIKMTHAETGMDADICFDQEGGIHMGKMIKHMISVVPAMKPLVLVLKYFLHQRELNVTFKGGVGSFLLQLMVIASIQHHAKVRQHLRYTTLQNIRTKVHARELNKAMNSEVKKGKKAAQVRKTARVIAQKKAEEAVISQQKAYRQEPSVDLGTMLIEFLEFYGRTLDTKNVGISVRGQGSLYRKVDRGFLGRRPGRAELLSMENPESPSVDIGANSYAYRRVARAISNSYEMLTAKLSSNLMSRPSETQQQSLLSLIIDVEAARSSAKQLSKPVKDGRRQSSSEGTKDVVKYHHRKSKRNGKRKR